jgi:hypothetical protein
MGEKQNLTVSCPECNARLVVDVATGEVISHRKTEEPIAGGKNFEDLLGDLDRGKDEAEEIFSREMAAMKDRDRLLEEKFDEAFKRAEEDPDEGPPVRPFDLD